MTTITLDKNGNFTIGEFTRVMGGNMNDKFLILDLLEESLGLHRNSISIKDVKHIRKEFSKQSSTGKHLDIFITSFDDYVRKQNQAYCMSDKSVNKTVKAKKVNKKSITSFVGFLLGLLAKDSVRGLPITNTTTPMPKVKPPKHSD